MEQRSWGQRCLRAKAKSKAPETARQGHCPNADLTFLIIVILAEEDGVPDVEEVEEVEEKEDIQEVMFTFEAFEGVSVNFCIPVLVCSLCPRNSLTLR